MNNNIDLQVVQDFGDEWSNFDQSELSQQELLEMFNLYFDIFPWEKLSENVVGFGTKLEKRFSQKQISEMMENAGLENIIFSDNIPYWCAIGYKK